MSQQSSELTATDLFNEGRLAEASELATKCVTQQPGDVKHRWLLAKLLCFSGEYQRADVQLKVVLQQDREMTSEVLLFRNLIKAQLARQQCFRQGRVPNFTEPPPQRIKRMLEAIMLLNSETPESAAEVVADANSAAPSFTGKINGEAFEGFFDWDDVCATFFEMFTPNGDYYWVPFELISEIDFRPLIDIRDVLWRQGSVKATSGEEINAYFPALYIDTEFHADEAMRQGRAGDWSESFGVRRGVGARGFAVGEDGHANLAETLALSFNPISG